MAAVVQVCPAGKTGQVFRGHARRLVRADRDLHCRDCDLRDSFRHRVQDRDRTMSAVMSAVEGAWEAARLRSSLGSRDREWIVRRLEQGEWKLLRTSGRKRGNSVRRFGTQASAETAARIENAKLARGAA